MAEKLEEQKNIPEAILAYEKAVDYFTMDSKNNYKTYKSECSLKVADLSCENLKLNNLQDFPKIITVSV